VLEDAADVPQRQLRQPAVQFACEKILAVLRQRLVHVHARTVVANHGLGHEGGGLAVGMSDVADHVLHRLQFVRLAQQRVELHADFALARVGDFMVVHLDRLPQRFQHRAHFRAQIVQRIDWRHREITALHAGAMAVVAFVVLVAR